ncbi:MAG: helix-turn-helix domain-containing protein [Bacteroidota bacterium]
MSVSTVHARFKQIRKHLGLTQTQIGEHLGITKSAVSAYERGVADPPYSTVHSYLTSQGVSVEWLLHNQGEMLLASHGDGSSAMPVLGSDGSDEEARVLVALYGEVSAGPGRVPLEPTRFRAITPRQFALDFGAVPPASGRSVRRGYFVVVGDSAAPTYFDGDLVPVEVLPEPTQQFRQDTLYVFHWGDDLLLKRLRRLEDGRVRASSLNPSVEPFDFEPVNGHEFAVVALVRETAKQQLYAALVGRFLRAENRGQIEAV